MRSKQLAELGRTLKAVRKAQGLTQADVAERAEMAEESYGRIERGQTEPGAFVLKSLKRVLAVSIDEMLGDDRETSAGVRERVGTFGVSVADRESPDMKRVVRRLQKLSPKAIRMLSRFLAALER